MVRASVTWWAALLCVLVLTGSAAHAAPACTQPPAVGTECTFNAYDFSLIEEREIELAATCRAIGEQAYVFVENGLWDAGVVIQDQVDELLRAFEEATPNYPNKGIYKAVVNAFWSPPDEFDNDPHIYLVIHSIESPDITDIPPVTAYFREVDLGKDYNDPLPGSNEHEVIFLHEDEVSGDERLSDLTRELVNMLHWVQDKDEEEWVKDAIARQMALELGYTAFEADLAEFAKTSHVPLVGKEVTGRLIIYHGATTLFGVFIREKTSLEFINQWMSDELNGTDGFEKALSLLVASGDNFCTYFHNWVLQNGIDRGDCHYTSIDLPPFQKKFIRVWRAQGGQARPALSEYAGSYVDIKLMDVRPEDTLQVTFEIDETLGISVSAVKLNTENSTDYEIKELLVYAGEATIFAFEDVGRPYDRLLIATSRCTKADLVSYTVSAKLNLGSPLEGDEDAEGGDGPGDGDAASDGDFQADTDGPRPDDDDFQADGDRGGDQGGDQGGGGGGPAAGDMDDSGANVFGSRYQSCPELKRCYEACDKPSCEEECYGLATLQAREQFDAYTGCISGDNAESVNCLDMEDKEKRTSCMMKHCKKEVELCTAEEEADDSGDSGGSGCGCKTASETEVGGLALLALAVLALRRRRRRRSFNL